MYLEKERPPPVLAILKGTGMHAAAETNFKQKLESHEDLPMPDMIDAAVAAFESEIQKTGITLTKPEKAVGQDASIEAAKKDLLQFVAGFAVYQAPHYQPVELPELTVRIPVPRSTHDLLGKIDIIAEIDNKPGRRIRDWKTSKRKKSAVDAAETAQLTFYSAGHQVLFSEPPADVGLDNLVITSKGVTRQELVEQRDKDDFAVLASRLNAMEQGVKAGVFLPAPEGSWYCRSCVFAQTCPYVNRARLAAASGEDE
jgi:CRISPR/Cas system-associated exonuclease Cas4 (RecB family)